MIDLDQLIASMAPDVEPASDVVTRHRALLGELADRGQRSDRRAVVLDPDVQRAHGRLRPIVLAAAMLAAVVGGLHLLGRGARSAKQS